MPSSLGDSTTLAGWTYLRVLRVPPVPPPHTCGDPGMQLVLKCVPTVLCVVTIVLGVTLTLLACTQATQFVLHSCRVVDT